MRLTPEQSQMVEDNIGLAYHARNQYRGKFGWLDPEELLSACFLGLVKAAKAFNPEKAQFSTYAMRSMYNTIIKELIPSKPVIEPCFLEDLAIDKEGEHSNWESFLGSDAMEEDILRKAFCKELIKKIIKDNPGKGRARTRKIIAMYYINPDLKQQEIADIAGCSQKNVSFILRGLRKKYGKELQNY